VCQVMSGMLATHTMCSHIQSQLEDRSREGEVMNSICGYLLEHAEATTEFKLEWVTTPLRTAMGVMHLVQQSGILG